MNHEDTKTRRRWDDDRGDPSRIGSVRLPASARAAAGLAKARVMHTRDGGQPDRESVAQGFSPVSRGIALQHRQTRKFGGIATLDIWNGLFNVSSSRRQPSKY